MQWYTEWQRHEHSQLFDWRSRLTIQNLLYEYDRYNDVRLLNERVDRGRPVTVAELGCATGEFYRYLQVRYPAARYVGIDVSEVAVRCAERKYPKARFLISQPTEPVEEILARAGLGAAPEVVYAKDVVHHQTQPLALLEQMVQQASEATILRLRTKDVGPTEWDPERSCQYHYGGWVPYIVMNLQEVTAAILGMAPEAEIVAYRHHMILGGQVNRFLPKDCYLRATGTAETAVGIFRRTNAPGRITVVDRPDERGRKTWDYALRTLIRRCWPAAPSDGAAQDPVPAPEPHAAPAGAR